MSSSPLSRICIALLFLSTSIATLPADKPANTEPVIEPARTAVHQVLKPDESLPDARIKQPRHTRDKFHPWTPPTDLESWLAERQKLKTQVAVSNGLWPMPPQEPLNPTIHGKINRGDYTIEKVYFESHPGHYVSGNLYRPVHYSGRIPGILCPHGHWQDGRFYKAPEEKAMGQLANGAEKHLSGAYYPVQARMAQLARLGCVVFHYDMVGYADSQQVGHGGWFQNVDAELRLQNGMGLQTFNSIRSLDFLLSLPEVDPDRIGVTGSSGGGTQTFMLCALDERPDVAFPAVMVSTGMQGGCVCENASYLRQDINNVAIAALFAPKPLAMSGANDWTIEIETKGLPELKTIYSLYGKEQWVAAQAWPEFQHNYNSVAREAMYSWMIEYLDLDADIPLIEEDFWPVPPEELSVFDDDHPLPANAKTGAELAAYMTEYSQTQWDAMVNHPGQIYAEYQRVMEGAVPVLLGESLSAINTVEADLKATTLNDSQIGELQLKKGLLKREANGAAIPYIYLQGENFNGEVVLWMADACKQHLFTEQGDLREPVRQTLKNGYAIAACDLFLSAESLQGKSFAEQWQVDESFPGYTFCFNKPLLTHRVQDILTTIRFLQQSDAVKKIHLKADGNAAVASLLANGRMNITDKLGQLKLDLGQFDFSKVTSSLDPAFLPGALKYGGLFHLGLMQAPFESITLYGVGFGGESYSEFSPKYTSWLRSPVTRRATINMNTDSSNLAEQIWE
ncbi:Acetyl xylan esterase (AXE1) [Polystyrenella longa]|uniref:Acetyl xylan esterase (AXE1) n=1 Tax=Polystyrenella longa TaxID=2528007 RepID=A0A518CQC7_9PLAN|nr:acetylxylan esterase [Polystyrenella longa]QDU81425.1 Acetyl xylan esterase (AXE1) [Polystyrenella longa]